MKTLFMKLGRFVLIFMFLIFSGCGNDEEIEPQKVKEQETQQPTMQQKTETDTAKEDTMITESQKTTPQAEELDNAKLDAIPETYKVQDGETLASIADKFYGDSNMWFDIFAVNESDINNWNKIYPGQTLVMPSEDVNEK